MYRVVTELKGRTDRRHDFMVVAPFTAVHVAADTAQMHATVQSFVVTGLDEVVKGR